MFKKIYKSSMVILLLIGGVTMILWILGGLVLLIVFVLGGMYNKFIVLRNRIENSESQIDVQLKRRYDLIPNLVETVKGYAKHEKGVFAEVTKARSALMRAKTIKGKAKATNQIEGALKTLFAVAEAYPKLRANENFMMLQEELAGTESKIAYARQFYNDTVMSFNNSVQRFPSNLIANMFNFKEYDFFEIEEAAKKAVKVKF